ncbi:MAG: putative bifunctional diguanylate cyclase/phosphodiesterase [Nocardioidaceae bacterium]
MNTHRAPASPRALAVATTLTLAVATAAVATLAVAYQSVNVPGGWVSAAVLAALLVILHTRPERLVRATNHVESIQLDEVLIVPVLLMLSPLQSCLVIGLGSVAGSLVTRRPLTKTLFNLSQLLFATVCSIWIVRLLGAHLSTTPTLGDAVAGIVGAVALTVISAVSVRMMVSFATGVPLLPLLKSIGDSAIPWAGAVTLGGVGAICVGAQPWSAFLVVGLVVFVARAHTASVNEVIARRHAERLQEVIADLRGHTDPERVKQDLLSAARNLLGAKVAQVVPEDSADSGKAYSASMGQGQRLRVDERRGFAQWDDRDRSTLVALAGVAGDVLRSAEVIARLRTITNSQTEGVIALDLDACITFANPAAVSMLKARDTATLLGAPLREKLTLRHRRRTLDFDNMVAQRISAQDADAILGPSDGDTVDIAYSITPLLAEEVHVGAVLVMRNVTERRAFQDELTRRALHDELTGLPNRRLLIERLDHAMSRSRTTGFHHGLLFLDLDRFKLVNDSYGHVVGDKLLMQVAARLVSGLSPSDSVARVSGDEFVILIEDVSDIDAVTLAAERVLNVLQEPFDVDGHHIFSSASIGVGVTREGQERNDILAMIDAAAYAAKAAGRNCYCVSTDASVHETRARLDLEVSLRTGLDEDQLELHYQPIVEANGGEMVGAEALIRWRSPDRGVLWPDQFVPMAEETGLIIPMGRWVLEQSCRTAQRWNVQHPDRKALSVSVNLSALQFSQHRLTETVARILKTTGLPAQQLCLEITETVLMTETVATLATLESLHSLGVRVAIDDFGTGYSSLSYLKRFPIDVVKLDRTFIEGLVTDPVDAEIAGAVVRLSSALGMTTVAEGVETDAQRRMLVQLNCPLMQGYLTARPLTESDFEVFWTNNVEAHRAGVDSSNVTDIQRHRTTRQSS